MSQSLSNIIVHLVFSTKYRRPLLRDGGLGQLDAYITGILKNHDSPLIEINSVADQNRLEEAGVTRRAPGRDFILRHRQFLEVFPFRCKRILGSVF